MEKGFLGGLPLNKYWPPMDRVACNITMPALILSLHATEEGRYGESSAQKWPDHQDPELWGKGETDAVVPGAVTHSRGVLEDPEGGEGYPLSQEG